MANPEHLAILKQGVEVWNKWRFENTKVVPDFTFIDFSYEKLIGFDLEVADFTGASLAHVDMRNTNLSMATLKKSNLSHVSFLSTDLSHSDITEADLYNSALHGTDLFEADLTGANLVGVSLIKCNFTCATLSDVNFQGASLFEVVFADNDLSEAVGLEKLHHMGPSIVDFRTLQKSKNLPLEFLRGVGLPDRVIEYLPSLIDEPIQFYSCFISYSSMDEDFANRLYADLQNNGVRCWFAPEDMKIGDKIRKRIDEVIRIHDKLLLILSENSIDSEWVEKEVESAFEQERKRKEAVLFPIRLDDAVMDCDAGWVSDIKRRYIGDFTEWKRADSYQKSFNRLLKDLKTEINKP